MRRKGRSFFRSKDRDSRSLLLFKRRFEPYRKGGTEKERKRERERERVETWHGTLRALNRPSREDLEFQWPCHVRFRDTQKTWKKNTEEPGSRSRHKGTTIFIGRRVGENSGDSTIAVPRLGKSCLRFQRTRTKARHEILDTKRNVDSKG